MARSDRGGIDFYQYWKEIQVLKLIPFTKKVNGIIVKDGCGSYSHWYIQYVYLIKQVDKLD